MRARQMKQGIHVSSSGKGKGKGVGVVIPTLTASRDTVVTIDVKGAPRQNAKGD